MDVLMKYPGATDLGITLLALAKSVQTYTTCSGCQSCGVCNVQSQSQSVNDNKVNQKNAC